MLLVNASKGPSKIHGLGLIARENIAQGKLIWRYEEGIDHAITIPQLRKLSKWAAQQVVWYGIFNEDLEVFILSGDDDRFTNHSDNANSAFSGRFHTRALRSIKEGQEITINYSIWKEIESLHKLGIIWPGEFLKVKD